MFCRILYKHLNQKREDYRVFHFFMDFKIIGEFFRIAQQQNFEVIFAVIRLRRHRHHLACIAENIGEIIGRNTAHRLCMVVLSEVNHAVNKVQTVHVKMRTNLDFQVIHLDFLFFQLLLIQRDLQTSDLMNHVSEFIVNLLQLYQISFRHLIGEIPIVIFLKIFRKHSDRLQDFCFQMEQQHGTGNHHQKCNAEKSKHTSRHQIQNTGPGDFNPYFKRRLRKFLPEGVIVGINFRIVRYNSFFRQCSDAFPVLVNETDIAALSKRQFRERFQNCLQIDVAAESNALTLRYLEHINIVSLAHHGPFFLNCIRLLRQAFDPTLQRFLQIGINGVKPVGGNAQLI